MNELVTVAEIDISAATPKINNFVLCAKSTTIEDDEHYRSASELLRGGKRLRKYIEEFYKPTKDALNDAKNKLMQAIKAHTALLAEGEKILIVKISEYHAQKEKERRERERKLQEEMKKKQEDALLEEAERTQDESILDRQIITPAIKIENSAKAEGVSYRGVYCYEIVDPELIPREYLMVDDKKIGQIVRATKATINIPGVKVWKDKSTVIRT